MAFLDAAVGVLGEAAGAELLERGRVCFPVGSSAISELCYSIEGTLSITFTDGSSYEIPNFPPLELARWLAAPSKGAYFNLRVRGQY